MSLWRDGVATVFVAIAVGLYVAWAIGRGVPGFDAVNSLALAVLVLGMLASAFAVVPGFGQLLRRGSRLYFATASLIGFVALGAGIYGLFGQETLGVTLLVVLTVALWAMSTLRHVGVHVPVLRPHRI